MDALCICARVLCMSGSAEQYEAVQSSAGQCGAGGGAGARWLRFPPTLPPLPPVPMGLRWGRAALWMSALRLSGVISLFFHSFYLFFFRGGRLPARPTPRSLHVRGAGRGAEL